MTNNVKINTSKTNPQGKGSDAKPDAASDPMKNNDFLRRSRRTARSVSPAPLNALMAVLKDRVAEDADLKNLSLLSYTGTKDGSNLSGVACYLVTGNNVIMHFIASKHSCELVPRDISIGEDKQKVTMPTHVPDLYSKATIANIRKDVLAQLPSMPDNVKFHNAGLTVIRVKHTAPEFTDEASNFANIAYDAILDFAAHKRISNEDLFNVRVLQGRSPRATVSTQPQQVLSIDGLPKRADITVSTTVQSHGAEGMVPVELTRVAAYMNFIYQKPKRQIYQGQEIQSQACFQPEIIITEATAVNHANTLESLLYAIYSVDAAIDQHRWLNMYRHNHAGTGKNSVNEYNLGALNIDLPPTGNKEIDGKVLPTGDPAWIEDGLFRFADTYFQPTVGKAIDIPESGPNARLLSILRLAVQRPNMTEAELHASRQARLEIIKAGNNLTGDRFGVLLGEAPLFLPAVERTLIGSYVEDGEAKDIAHIDHVMMSARYGEKDEDFVLRMEETFTLRNINENVRVKDRIGLATSVKGSTLQVEELGYRLRLHPAAHRALSKAISQNEISLSIDGVGSISAQPERGAGYLSGEYGVAAEDVRGFSQNSAGTGGTVSGNWEW